VVRKSEFGESEVIGSALQPRFHILLSKLLFGGSVKLKPATKAKLKKLNVLTFQLKVTVLFLDHVYI
jgi:hypothetical protein